MQAFHNDPAVKAKYLLRVQTHMNADELVRGTGYQAGEDGSPGKMCAVGCTLEAYNHDRYPIELGIPVWLAHVEDRLFEGMSEEKSRTWPRDFLSTIRPGADLEQIKGPFLIMVLEGTLGSFDHAKFPAVKSAIDGSIALWRRDDIGSPDWKAAAAAALAARAAAWAVGAAAAAGAARAAAAAALAARAAAWAAAWAAEAALAARTAKYDYFADELIKFLAAA